MAQHRDCRMAFTHLKSVASSTHIEVSFDDKEVWVKQTYQVFIWVQFIPVLIIFLRSYSGSLPDL